jgi:hypothetical protein
MVRRLLLVVAVLILLPAPTLLASSVVVGKLLPSCRRRLHRAGHHRRSCAGGRFSQQSPRACSLHQLPSSLASFLPSPRLAPARRCQRVHLTSLLVSPAPPATTLSCVQNYKRNGDPFINYLSLNPVHDALGRLTHYVGVQVRVCASVGVYVCVCVRVCVCVCVCACVCVF